MLLAVSTQTSIGLFVLFLSLVISVVYGLVNLRQGRAEVGSEIELAANRKPYLPDSELEGRKLDRTLSIGLLGLFVLGIGLPLYWLQEPSRQDGAVERIREEFINRGAGMYAPTADGGYNCAFCHGPDGGGGSTPYTITDAEGRFVKEVQWKGPALNTVFLRYSREEIRYILEYGRLATPMPAWGTAGGGPLTEQQLQNLIDYIGTFQITREEAQAAATEELARAMEERDATCVATRTDAARAGMTEEELAAFDPTTVDVESCPMAWASEGEALFNLGYNSGFAGGAYSCGRCHTPGWSYGEKGPDGAGAMGRSLDGVLFQFPGDVLGVTQMTDFVCTGSTDGARYGQAGQGTGRMPGFCVVPAVEAAEGEVGVEAHDAGTPEEGGMYTEEQVQQIVEYVRSLAR
jgi:mono/diheme cytochrome c family protein